MTEKRTTPAAALLLATLVTVTGVLHFAVPKAFDALIPRWLPGSARTYTLVSGAAELACAAGLLVPRTRRAAALATALLFVLVFPGNVQMALDWRDRSAAEQAVAYGRLPLQIPLIWWALRVRRSAR